MQIALRCMSARGGYWHDAGVQYERERSLSGHGPLPTGLVVVIVILVFSICRYGACRVGGGDGREKRI